MESGKFTADEVFYDICSTIFAGLDTSSHALTSILYFLKKNPDVMTKLKSELAKYGITKDLNPEDPTFKDKIERCDYLTYCVKEGLRLDPPLNTSIFYEALENIDICGIPIPKGGVIQLHALPPHLNPDQWYEPFKFIPERFDPEHKYFQPPKGEKKIRHTLSYMPFSYGPRNCAGQAMAYLTMKIILSRIMTKLDFEVDQGLLENEDARFSVLSVLKLKSKIIHSEYD